MSRDILCCQNNVTLIGETRSLSGSSPVMECLTDLGRARREHYHYWRKQGCCRNNSRVQGKRMWEAHSLIIPSINQAGELLWQVFCYCTVLAINIFLEILVGCLPRILDIIISNIAKEMLAPKHRNTVSIIIRITCYVRLEESMPTYWIKDRTSFNEIWEVLLFHFSTEE